MMIHLEAKEFELFHLLVVIRTEAIILVHL
jgi:hypothetical protein